METRIFYEHDADLKLIQKKKVGILGFGSQGHAHALNLRDQGVEVLVGLRAGSPSVKKAQDQGFEVLSPDEVARRADLIMILVPDELQPALYREAIAPYLKRHKILAFAHGFNIHFRQIVPPPDVDVILVAPKGPGHMVRHEFQRGSGVPALIAVHQDASGKAQEVALSYAAGIGAGRAGIFLTTFAEETETDLFGEQVVLCGGLTALIMAAFDTLVEAGYSPTAAYFECLHELKLIVDLIYEGGISNMRYSISNTAKYGDVTRGPRVIGESVRREMKKILEEIRSGAFAREWVLENQAGRPVYHALLEQGRNHPIEKVGAELRSRMPWIQEKKIVDPARN